MVGEVVFRSVLYASWSVKVFFLVSMMVIVIELSIKFKIISCWEGLNIDLFGCVMRLRELI